MDAKVRRNNIIDKLVKSNQAIKGIQLAEIFGVTRQIIVKDIALLRAKGNNIIATPEGYMISNKETRLRSIVAVNHGYSRIGEELECVIKYGGHIEDVIVEHPIYGEIRVPLMIKNMNDLEKFMRKNKEIEAKPLSNLTNGVHLHTISAENQEDMDCIKSELKKRGFIIL